MNFETKDSGERVEYVSGMHRDIQSGKPRFDLLLVDEQPYDEQFLTRFAKLLERGAEKYGERNWQLANSAEEVARFKASAHRHFIQWVTGEVDEDHAAAVAFNIMAAEYVKWKLENDSESPVSVSNSDPGPGEDSSGRDPSKCYCAWHQWIRQEGPKPPGGVFRGRGPSVE